MANFRVAMADATINFSVQNHTRANASSNSQKHNAASGFARSPADLTQRCRVRVIFQGNGHTKFSRQKFDWISAFPTG